jgi:hypothetical protein
VAGDIWLTGRCGSSIAGVHSRGIALDPRKLDLAAVDVSCRGDRLLLRIADQMAKLREPANRLAAVLPRDIAPTGSRAVWTGETLLVATPHEGRLSVARHRCDEHDLVRR